MHDHWYERARERKYVSRCRMRNLSERKIHGGVEIFGVFMSRQSAPKERNRADKFWWKFYFRSFVVLNWYFHPGRAMFWTCLLWELIAFAKTVNLSVNWSIEITLRTFVMNHDPNIAYFWKRYSCYDKEKIMYLCGSRCDIKKERYKHWNEIDAEDMLLY